MDKYLNLDIWTPKAFGEEFGKLRDTMKYLSRNTFCTTLYDKDKDACKRDVKSSGLNTERWEALMSNRAELGREYLTKEQHITLVTKEHRERSATIF